MANYNAIKGQTLIIDLLEDSRDNGWVISGNKAIHSGCNAGFIELKVNNFTPNVPNLFEYAVSDYQNGTVQLYVGNSTGAVRSSNSHNGTPFQDYLTPFTNDKIRFYATGDLTLEFFRISPVKADGVNNGVTLGFYEGANRWGGNFSYLPENMIRFVNGFYTFRNGALWKHNTNEVRNNWYNEQFSSQIIFYVNLSPDEVKQFHTMRQNSNKVWSVPEVKIPAYYGKANGQKSRLKSGRFKNLNNQWFADFLRDMEDTRFVTDIDALMKGAILQGKVMEIKIENKDTVEVRLVSIDVIVSKSEYTF